MDDPDAVVVDVNNLASLSFHFLFEIAVKQKYSPKKESTGMKILQSDILIADALACISYLCLSSSIKSLIR